MLLLLVAAALLLLVVSVRYALKSRTPVSSIAVAPPLTAPAGPAPDLLSLDRLVFEWASHADQKHRRGLCSRIFDEVGNEVGLVVFETARSWLARLADPRVGVYDRNDTKVIDIAARSGKQPVEIADGAGNAVGSIVPKNRARTRFTLKKSSWQIMGGIEWQRRKDRDVAWAAVVKDTTGKDLAQIIYPKNRLSAHRLRGQDSAAPPEARGRARRLLSGSADAYFLEVTADSSPELRLLMLASAAAVDIVDFHKHFTDDG